MHRKAEFYVFAAKHLPLSRLIETVRVPSVQLISNYETKIWNQKTGLFLTLKYNLWNKA